MPGARLDLSQESSRPAPDEGARLVPKLGVRNRSPSFGNTTARADAANLMSAKIALIRLRYYASLFNIARPALRRDVVELVTNLAELDDQTEWRLADNL